MLIGTHKNSRHNALEVSQMPQPVAAQEFKCPLPQRQPTEHVVAHWHSPGDGKVVRFRNVSITFAFLERHIIMGEQRIAHQRARVKYFQLTGFATEEAQRLRQAFETAQTRRMRLREELLTSPLVHFE